MTFSEEIRTHFDVLFDPTTTAYKQGIEWADKVAELELELALNEDTIRELDKDNQRLRNALRHIIDDQMGVGGTMSEYTATVAIAKNALAATGADNG